MVMDTGNDAELADYLRNLRTTTQADVDKLAQEHDVDDVPASDRWSAVAAA